MLALCLFLPSTLLLCACPLRRHRGFNTPSSRMPEADPQGGWRTLMPAWCALVAYLNDLYEFDPRQVRWTALIGTGSLPRGRGGMGIAALGGFLYVFGGIAFSGKREADCGACGGRAVLQSRVEPCGCQDYKDLMQCRRREDRRAARLRNRNQRVVGRWGGRRGGCAAREERAGDGSSRRKGVRVRWRSGHRSM